MAGLTNVDGLEESPVHGSTNGVCGVLAEHDMATIVAVLESRQDVLRIIRAISICLDDTLLRPDWWVWNWQSGLSWGGHNLRTCSRNSSHRSQ